MGSACLDLLDLIPNCVISYDNCVYVFLWQNDNKTMKEICIRSLVANLEINLLIAVLLLIFCKMFFY